MRNSNRRSEIFTIVALLALGLTQAGCGGGDAGGETAAAEGERASADSPAVEAAPTGWAAEPILYSDAQFSYVGFRLSVLTELHAALNERVGDRVQLRVIPYVGSDPSTGESVLKGETLSIFVQQPDADLTALQVRGDGLIALVQQTFPDLGENYTVRVNARLPASGTVADLNPELSDACGDRNLVQSGVKLDEYEPGRPDELFQFLCDGAKVVDPFFLEQGWDHLPGAWRTTDESQE